MDLSYRPCSSLLCTYWPKKLPKLALTKTRLHLLSIMQLPAWAHQQSAYIQLSPLYLLSIPSLPFTWWIIPCIWCTTFPWCKQCIGTTHTHTQLLTNTFRAQRVTVVSNTASQTYTNFSKALQDKKHTYHVTVMWLQLVTSLSRFMPMWIYLPRARMCEGVKQFVLSVCQFVSLSVRWKNFKSEYRQV